LNVEMGMSKLEIYVKMFELILPYVRSIQSQNAGAKSRDLSCFFETELIHNLPKSLLDENITEHDVWFLNNQARYYYQNCNDEISPNYNQNIKYVKELFKIIPDELKPKLLWQGP